VSAVTPSRAFCTIRNVLCRHVLARISTSPRLGNVWIPIESLGWVASAKFLVWRDGSNEGCEPHVTTNQKLILEQTDASYAGWPTYSILLSKYTNQRLTWFRTSKEASCHAFPRHMAYGTRVSMAHCLDPAIRLPDNTPRRRIVGCLHPGCGSVRLSSLQQTINSTTPQLKKIVIWRSITRRKDPSK
jgi:hypothetical protein